MSQLSIGALGPAVQPMTVFCAIWCCLGQGAALGQEGAAASGIQEELGEGTVVALPPPNEVHGGAIREDTASDDREAPDGQTSLDVIDPPTLFGEAVVHYQEARYSQSVEAFERFLRLGPDNSSAHYNLGNALLRNGELGRAIAAYRRARARAPRDEDVRANLLFARTSARDALAVPDAGAVPRTLAFWHYSFSKVERTWLAVLFSLLFWSGLVWLRATKSRGGKAGGWLAALSGVLFVALAGSLMVDRLTGERVAIVLPAEVDVHTAPQEDSVVRFKLHAGSEVRLEDQQSGWVLVELPDGERGWLEEGFVESSI